MTQHDNILIVHTKRDSNYCFIGADGCLWSNYGEVDVPECKLPPGTWRIVGRALELTEGQWRGVVPVLPSGTRWANYEHPERLLLSATESGFSLLRSHGIEPETNPLILKKEGV